MLKITLKYDRMEVRKIEDIIIFNKDNTKEKNKDYTLKNDYIFKEIFSKPGNEYMMSDFLRVLSNIEVEEIEVFKEVELLRECEFDKCGTLDIKAIVNEEEIIDVEMQKYECKDIEKRMIYYASKLVIGSLARGQDYEKLKKVIAIVILDKGELPTEGYITRTRIVAEENEKIEVIKNLEFIFIELKKFRKVKNENFSDIAN